jgi:hypothetical protein
MPIRAHIRFIIASLCAASLSGCASVPMAAPPAPPSAGVAARSVYTAGTTRWTTDSDIRVTRVVSHADSTGTWDIEIRSDNGPIRTLGLIGATAGPVHMHSLTEPTRNGTRTLVFSPPLLVMPSVLTEGVSAEAEVAEFAGSPGQGSEPVRAGSATSTIMLTEPFTPSGDPDAIGLRREIRIDIGPARIRRVTDLVIHPGVGVVRERSTRVVRVFGITVDQDAEIWTRAGLPARPSAERDASIP